MSKSPTPRPHATSSTRLPPYYGELADALAESGNGEDSSIANAEATKLLVDLVDLAPSNTSYHFELARRFSTEAALLRDAGKGKEARPEQRKGSISCATSSKSIPSVSISRLEFALSLGDMTDLYSEGKQPKRRSIVAMNRSNLMEQLLNDDLDMENNDAKRNRYREVYADLQIRYAEHLEKFSSKDARLKQLARKFYEKGINQLQALIDSGSTARGIRQSN